MDNFKKKYFKYKAKYINLQNGGLPNSKFIFLIDKAISSSLKEEIKAQFNPRFHAKLMDEFIGITVRKEFPAEHNRLLDIIRQNDFIVEEENKFLIVNENHFDINALQLSEPPTTTFIIHKDINSYIKNQQERKEQQELKTLSSSIPISKSSNEVFPPLVLRLKNRGKFNNLYNKVASLITTFTNESSRDSLPNDLQLIIQSIQKIID